VLKGIDVPNCNGSKIEMRLELDSTMMEVLGLKVQDSLNSPSGNKGATGTTGHVSYQVIVGCLFQRSMKLRHSECWQEALPGWKMEGKSDVEVVAVAQQG
jgi:hypothetical protein